MQVQHCSSHGKFVISTWASGRVSADKEVFKEILMTEEIKVGTTAALIPMTNVIQHLQIAERNLRQRNTHPKETVFIGVEAAQIQGLEVVLARVERKQKDWVDGADLASTAKADAAATRAAMKRLRPALEKARREDLSAEELMEALNAEPDAKVARERFLSRSSGSVTVRDDEEVFASSTARPIPNKYAATKAWPLRAVVSCVDVPSSSARLVVVETPAPSPLFPKSELGIRSIMTVATGEKDLRYLSFAMACQVQVDVELAISITITPSGLSYASNFVRFVNPGAMLSSLKNAMTQGDQLF